MKRKFLDNHRLRHTLPFAAACFTVGLALFACADKDVENNDNNGKALVTFNVSAVQSKAQDQAKAAAKAGLPVTRAAFANQLALQNLTPEDLTMQKLPVQGAAASSDLCLIETTVPGLPSQWEDDTPTRANITTMPTMQNFSTTAFYGSSDTSLEPWFYDKDTKKDGTLVTPIYWDWIKTHACFYAVYPKPDNNKIKLSPKSYTGTPYVDFEVEPNVTNQKDLMTACSGNVHTDIGTMSATAPRTDLTFRHALTAVRFKVGENLSWNKTITKVEIVGAKSKGRYTLPTDKTVTGSWDASTLSAPTTFTLDGVSVSTSTAVNNVIMGNAGDNYVFYMIPQPLTGVSVNIYFNNATTPSLSIPLKGSWKPGTTKTYALSQNTSTWQYELTVTGPSPAEYSATSTGNYKIQSYRQDGAVQQPVPWKVVGYDTDGDGTFSMTEPLPSWFTGLTTTNGIGSINPAGEVGTANLVPDPTSVDKLAQMNAALKQNPKGSPTSYYDLSTHNIKGATIPRSTANCYVISHPGYYKIPLVYGSAIIGGNTKTNSYISSAPVTIIDGRDFILHKFKDHSNQDITDPWIEKTNGGTNSGINDAKVVWADEVGLVKFSATKIVRDASNNAFVQFEVSAANIKNGNAVIAVTRGGTVVWSWHLWFIHDDALNTIPCWNFQNHRYDFTQESLGMKYTTWTGTSYTSPRSVKVKVKQEITNSGVQKESILTITQNPGNVRQGFTTLYQWGCKDAFPGNDMIVPEGFFYRDGGNHLTIPTGIQNPENNYGFQDNWWHYYYFWTNLWSANNTTMQLSDVPVVKTIYDPCPAGYRLPGSFAFTGFTKTGNQATRIENLNVLGSPWSTGLEFNNKITAPDASVYFHASGYRYWIGGTLVHSGEEGSYWTAAPASSAHGFCLYFKPEMVDPHYDFFRSHDCSVRPIADN